MGDGEGLTMGGGDGTAAVGLAMRETMAAGLAGTYGPVETLLSFLAPTGGGRLCNCGFVGWVCQHLGMMVQ